MMYLMGKKNQLVYALFLLVIVLYSIVIWSDETYVVISRPLPYHYENNPLLNLKYDSKTFDLAYKTFVFNGNVYDAFVLSLVAVRQMPNLVVWHERLAQTATWTNNPDIALEQYVYLIKTKKMNNFL